MDCLLAVSIIVFWVPVVFMFCANGLRPRYFISDYTAKPSLYRTLFRLTTPFSLLLFVVWFLSLPRIDLNLGSLIIALVCTGAISQALVSWIPRVGRARTLHDGLVVVSVLGMVVMVFSLAFAELQSIASVGALGLTFAAITAGLFAVPEIRKEYPLYLQLGAFGFFHVLMIVVAVQI